MSVVTNLTVAPSRLTTVWKFLLDREPEGITSSQLENLVRPASLQSRQGEDSESGSSAMFNDVMAEMQNLGIVDRGEDGKLTLSKDAPHKDSSSLVEYLERVLLDPLLAEEHAQRAFPKAMAWLLTRDPIQPPSWKGGYRAQITADCGSDVGSFDLTDEARCQQFIHWAIYLGFAWRLPTGNQDAVFPDPTEALKRNLPSVMQAGYQTPIEEVVSKLAERVPVLEGGRAREEVERLFSADKRRPEQTLSRSTSLALERLEHSGSIKMERPADASAWNLDRGTGLRAVSHITWLGGE
jgi:hypothetical protein